MVIALVCGSIPALPVFDVVRGLSIDVLTALRWEIFGNRHDPASSPVVIVAIDEESYRTAPFKGSPTITWTREIGRVLTSLVEGGAKIIGFDIVFPTSIEQSEIPFDNEILGNRLRGFDREFLRALAIASRSGKVVLGAVQHGDEFILPSPGQQIAVGRRTNIRLINVYVDRDGVVRRLPLTFSVDKVVVSSMAVEVASRALGSSPVFTRDKAMILAGYRVPSAVPNTMTLNFQGGADDIPSFSLADLRACVDKADKEFFHRNFNGKIVLVGSLLDIEDRKVTSKRFATGAERAWSPRCALPLPSTTGELKRGSIPGVYIHATAVNNLIRKEGIVEFGQTSRTLISIALAGVAGILALLLTPISAGLALIAIMVVSTGVATLAFEHAVASPLVEMTIAGPASIIVTIGYRFMVSDKQARFLRKTFALYLAPQVIEKMVASSKLPVLGGELRDVTIFFSDIVDFSSMAENLMPGELVALMNKYLSAMTDIIEEYGGYVDKYIGDSIIAVFGAPIDDSDHARNAARAALRCGTRLAALNSNDAAFQKRMISHRIGLNSGKALVGNVGSQRRFNYTVMSDAVNLASRLEYANKYFGTTIIASQATVALTGATFEWRELDTVRVKGRDHPVNIYELLAESGQQTQEQSACANLYANGLARWRGRDFTAAVRYFARKAEADPPSALFLARARELASQSPGPDWEPIFSLEGK